MGTGLQLAVLYRPGRNVEWQRRFTGEEIPDDAIEEAALHRDGLLEAGHRAELVRWDSEAPALAAAVLAGGGFDLVFNASSLEEVALLEALHIPCCGSGLDLVALDKAARKKLLSFHGVNTPPFVVFDEDARAHGFVVPLRQLRAGWEPSPPLGYPLFVKPVRGRGSSGITADSIVGDAIGLRRQVEVTVARLGQGALVESYIRGREVTVGIIGDPPRALTPLEIEYNQAPTNTYDHKKDNEIMHCPARLPEERLEAVKQTALHTFRALGARDFGRVDMIVDAGGRAHVLELNTFAGLQILTGRETHLHASYIGSMAKSMGLTRADVLEAIVDSARRRYSS